MRPAAATGALVGVVAILASAAWSAEAQDVPVLQEGTRVWVTTGDGSEQQGTVVAVTASELTLLSDRAALSIPLADIRRIEGQDSLGNGVSNGGVAGALGLGGYGVFLSYALCDAPDGCLSQDLLPIALLAGLGAGAGMGVGALIDWAIKGRQVLYASSRTAFAVAVTPTVRADAFGASAVLTW